MTGLLVNMNLWKNLLKHREFDAAIDHVAVTQIMKAKIEPATTRIMRLLDRLSAYSFNLYYVKGRDMILAILFGHKMTLSQELELKVETVVSGKFTDYYEKLKKNLKYMGERLQKFRSQRLDMLNKNRQCHAFEIGQIVYMYQARGSMVQTGSRKIACFFVGPLVIYKAVGPNQFLLMSLDGQIYPHLI